MPGTESNPMEVPDGFRPLFISILIPTHNRCDILLRTMESLRGLRIPGDVRAELVVVANACADATVIRVQAAAAETPFAVRCVVEPRLGLSHARNCAISESKGEIIAFLDDDVWVDENWLSGLVNVYRQAPADIVAGPVALWWEALKKPDWLGEPAERLLSCMHSGDNVIELNRPGQCVGANFSMRRRLIEEIGPFRPGLGRVGDLLFCGEETEFLTRALNAGKRMFYAPQAQVRHWVAPERATLAYLHKAAYGSGLARPYLAPALSPGGAMGIGLKYGFRAAAYGVLELLAWAAQCRRARVNHHIRRMTCWGNVVGAWRRARRRDSQGAAAHAVVAASGSLP